MILEIDNWKFDIDLTSTMEYSAKEAAEHCTCAYCRNFYTAIDDSHPELRPFLNRFGIDIEAPEELMPFDPTVYLASYCVKGRILSHGSHPIMIGGIRILPEREDEGVWADRFCLWVGPFLMPWVLDEPMEEVVSPANEQSFQDRMTEKLLRDTPLVDICS